MRKEITNYYQAEQFLSKDRNKTRRAVSSLRATQLERLDENSIAVYYHNTPVLTYFSDGRLVLNSGGWRSQTTKSRINEFSDVYVYAGENVIFGKSSWVLCSNFTYERVEFFDGIEIQHGKVLNNHLPEFIRRITNKTYANYRQIMYLYNKGLLTSENYAGILAEIDVYEKLVGRTMSLQQVAGIAKKVENHAKPVC